MLNPWGTMKKHHMKAMHHSMEAHKRAHHGHMHHSDPIVGGESESEGRVYGHGEFANMPKEVNMKAYPKAAEFGPSVLDDTQGEINRVQHAARAKTHKHLSNQH